MAKSVMGVRAPTPKPTVWALFYALGYFALPFILALLAIDIVLYLCFKYFLNTCYGVTCLF